MQEMPLERNQNLQNFMVSCGTIPPEPPRGLRLSNLCEHLYGAKKYFLFFFKRRWNLCTSNWARDLKNYLNHNQKHFTDPSLADPS